MTGPADGGVMRHGSRAAVLREMGLGPIWRLRGARHEEVEETAESVFGANAAADSPIATVEPGRELTRAVGARRDVAPPARTGKTPQDPSAVPERPMVASAIEKVEQPGMLVDTDRERRIATLSWDDLEADIRACRTCGLCERRRQAVPGVGDRQARWMLVGEGPGAEEDQRGEPFVGQAGKLLDNMLSAIGLKRGEDVYIANAVKCRPPHNRTPEKAELAACLPYLERQITLVRPQLLIALGRPAAQALLDMELSIAAARGKRFEHRGTPVVVTYHPAYLLRNPQDKAKAWEDLCFARRLMSEVAPRD